MSCSVTSTKKTAKDFEMCAIGTINDSSLCKSGSPKTKDRVSQPTSQVAARNVNRAVDAARGVMERTEHQNAFAPRRSDRCNNVWLIRRWKQVTQTS